jgi:hypothetical protein
MPLAGGERGSKMKWFSAIGSMVMGIVGFAVLIASCSAVQNSPEVAVHSSGSGADEAAAGLAPGLEIFDETKLKESVAPAWTVYAVAYEVCGERLAVQYIGDHQFMIFSKRNAKSDAEKREVDEAFAEFDEVVAHKGNARIEELDAGCVST